MISISNFVKSFLLTSIIFLVSFICLFTQNNKSNQANDYQLIYIFSIHDCPACIAYINEDIKCVNKKYQNVEVCGYILCDRKKEQKNFIKSQDWPHCVKEEVNISRKELNLKPATLYALIDSRGNVLFELNYNEAKKTQLCNFIESYIKN